MGWEGAGGRNFFHRGGSKSVKIQETSSSFIFKSKEISCHFILLYFSAATLTRCDQEREIFKILLKYN